MRYAAQFRADPVEMMDVGSDEYTRDFNEVKAMGSQAVRAAAPDSEPSRIARFWPAGGANWNSVARLIVAGRGLDRWEHARLLALMNVGMNDAIISVFETKYVYRFWRPVTAIRAADTDGNPDTAADPAWARYLAKQKITPASLRQARRRAAASRATSGRRAFMRAPSGPRCRPSIGPSRACRSRKDAPAR